MLVMYFFHDQPKDKKIGMIVLGYVFLGYNPALIPFSEMQTI